MAAICRLSSIRALRRGISLSTTQNIKCRAIATSSIKNNSVVESKSTTGEKKKSWVSYGFNEESELEDRRTMHEVFFVVITVSMVFTGFVLMFKPNTLSNTDWAQREAYLVLRYREEHGLPPIDQNLIDPAKIVLPTDEELGDTEVII